MPKKYETQAEKIIRRSKKYGAHYGNGVVKLDTLKRKKLSWLSKSILAGLGVPSKPKPQSICPACGTAAMAFELDHMGPWRQYVAIFAGPHITKTGKIQLCYVRALYNDPENLWWICKSCNRRKSDFISEDGLVPEGGVSGQDVSLAKLYK